MGQRSQIYIRINKQNGEKVLFPRYYGWNYGTRMISRARYTIEWLRQNLRYGWQLTNEEFITKLTRIMDTNFDYKDIVLGQDLIKEFEKEFSDEDFNETTFNQYNNDGQLYIDVICKYGEPDSYGHTDIEDFEVKYALVDSDNEKILSAEEYMRWETPHTYIDEKSWKDSEYHYKDEITFTEDNIAYIEAKTSLLTPQELEEFRTYDYVKSMGIKELPTVKEWYKNEFSEDSIYEEINENARFSSLYASITWAGGDDFYDVLGVNDSIVRERIFTKMAEIYNTDYNDIYNKWVNK